MRLDAGLTQEQLVKKLRRSQTYASKSESGERRLDLVDGWRFARRAAKTPRSFSTACKTGAFRVESGVVASEQASTAAPWMVGTT